MKIVIRFLRKHANYFSAIGAQAYLRFALTPKGAKIRLPIAGKTLTIRKGTPDLEVAISCLTGEFDILAHLLPKDFDGVIVDAGGYIGASALALRDLYPKARLIVVEPSEENIEILKENLVSVAQVDIVQAALVGAKTESITLRDRSTGAWGFTTVEAPEDKKGAAPMHQTPARTLSELGAPLDQIGLLKMDIEGAEWDILRNNADDLARVTGIFIELHDKIVPGCTDLFLSFSSNRVLIKADGEKYLSVKR